MNAPIRRLAAVVAGLFVALLVSSTIIQVFLAPSLNARPDNRRTQLSTYGRDRGDILVADKAIATSKPSSDQYKYLRTYPDGPAYAHLTGYFSFYGASGGIESTDNALLSGVSDKLFYRRVSDVFTGRKPKGASVALTINPAVQAAAIKAFEGQHGAAVAIDPRTGAILAMVSLPSYDPNVVASHDLTAVKKAAEQFEANPDRPLVNRAIGGNLYPPGSTFKLVTAAAALSTGQWSEDSVLPGPAALDLPQTSTPLYNHGRTACGPNDETTLLHAMEISCNTSFGWLGMKLGEDAMRAQAMKFGFDTKLSIPMVVTPSTFPSGLNPPQLAQSSIGQYDVRATPLEMAMVSAGIANGGRVMKPYLVKSVLTSDLTVLEQAEPEELSQAVGADVAGQLTRMMIAVVENGTGKRAQLDGIQVAGKTGTAEHEKGKPPHAWFTGFAPATNNPSIAVAVVVENGGKAGDEAFGGTLAAPIARAMMAAALKGAP